jgi:tRNA dimethylallyltransferase
MPDAPTAANVIAIFGPTGVGKTAVAVAVADLLRQAGRASVAVSADALQIYRGIETLTGAADAATQQRLEHRLVGFVPVSASFSVGRFAQLAHAEIDAIRSDGRVPIVVGGTGLYLRAALTNLDLKPPVAPEIRAAIAERLAQHGTQVLHAQLETEAPRAAARIAPTDSQRVTRALELLAAGEDPEREAQQADQLWTAHTRVATRLFGLTLERQELYEQINSRVDAMVAAGAADEVQHALGADAGPTVRKAVGFRELAQGDVELMKTRTRQYARRQLTWMRKLANVTLLDMTERSPQDVATQIVASLTGDEI